MDKIDRYRSNTIRINDLLRNPELGLFIPAYQRPYTWNDDHSKKLFDDILRFIDYMVNPINNPKSFEEYQILGTVIFIDSKDYIPVPNEYRKYLPEKIMSIIDGQQRITTVTLSNIVMHNKLTILLNDYKNKQSDSNKNENRILFQDFVTRTSMKVIKELKSTFLFENIEGKEPYCNFPKIIRAFEDYWSYEEENAVYNSAIGSLLFAYNLHSLDKRKKKGKWYKTNEYLFRNKDLSAANLKMLKYYASIEDLIEKIFKDQDSNEEQNEYKLLNLFQMMQNIEFSKAIDLDIGDDNFENYINELKQLKIEDTEEYHIVYKLLSLLYLIKYINRKLIVNTLIVENESMAFDLFESINTTGELLTPFETLIPKIVEAETSEEGYEQSISRIYVDYISDYLQSAKNKKDKTLQLIITFALSESGISLSKELKHQRDYLVNRYCNELKNIKEKREFIKRIFYLVEIMQKLWESEDPNYGYYKIEDKLDEETKVGFKSFIPHHIIVLAPIHRFITYYLDQKNNKNPDSVEIKKANENIVTCIKYCIGLTYLWRGAFTGHYKIDDVYRKIFQQKINKHFSHVITDKSLSYDYSEIADIEIMFDKIFVSFYDESLVIEEKWKNSFMTVDMDPKIAKFLLLLSYHNMFVDKKTSLLIYDKKRLNPMLTLKNWDFNNEIEHVAPKTPKDKDGWDTDIYIPPPSIKKLGNLLPIPKKLNQFLSNRNWDMKQMIHSIIVSEENNDDKLDILKSLGIPVNKLCAIVEIIKENMSNLSFYESMAQSEDWDKDHIGKRNENFAGILWPKLNEFLPIDIKLISKELSDHIKNPDEE